MSATAAADPVRAHVEEALNRIVADVTKMPCRVVHRARGAASRSIERVTTSVAGPIGLVRSVVELSLSGLLGTGGNRTAATPGASPAPVDTPAANSPTPRTSTPSPSSGLVVDGDTEDSSTDLPLHGYESLAASHVVARLERLAPGELEQIRDFELAHRGRRTILGKINQLLAGA